MAHLEKPLENRTVAVVSHILGGFDGVSIQAERLRRELEALGAGPVVRVAGRADGPGVDEVPDLLAQRPGPGLAGELLELLGGAGVIVADNILTLPQSQEPQGQRVLAEVLSELAGAGATVVVRHHDPHWDHDARPQADGFPAAVHDHVHHVAVSHHVAAGVAAHLGRQVGVWPNTVDGDLFDLDGGAVRQVERERLGVGDQEMLVLAPVRGYVARKNTAQGAAAALELAALGHRVRYWLTGADGVDRTQGPYHELGDRLVWGERSGSAAAMYAAADVVVLPSTWEGWGVPVVEALAAGRALMWGQYPARWELEAAGAQAVDWQDPERARRLAAMSGDAAALAANREVARQWGPDSLRRAVGATLGLDLGSRQ